MIIIITKKTCQIQYLLEFKFYKLQKAIEQVKNEYQ